MMVRRIQSPQGFTLIEILVAFTVLGFAVVYLVQVFSVNLRTAAVSQDYLKAVLHAEAVMREIVEKEPLEESSWQDELDRGYRYEASVTEVLRERSENLPIKLLEVEVVFTWEMGSRKKSLTLKTLKVVNRVDNRGIADQRV